MIRRGAVILARQKIADNRFEVSFFNFGFSVHRAVRKAIDNEVGRFVRTKGNDAR